MNVPLLDLKLQHQPIEAELREAFNRVLAHGRFILGPEVEILEKEVAAFCGARHAISCASGSDALLLALMAFDIGPGDEVITTPYTFFATASCIARVGARAVFVDISPCCYNLDPREVLRRITPRTKAIIPVHLYGQAADMAPWIEVARQKGIRVIEDAAQAIGAEYRGRPVGPLGDLGCFSFFPSKNLGCFGDGGMMVTNDETLAEKLRVLRVHGGKPKYYHHVLGINSRLDTLQAAILSVKLPHLRTWAEGRRRNAALYTRLMVEAGLAEAPAGCNGSGSPEAKGSRPLILPGVCQPGHVFNQFVIRTRQPAARDPLREHLQKAVVGTEIYYPVPLHLQQCFAIWGGRPGDFPQSERAGASTVALPIFPELTESQLRFVVETIASFDWKRHA